jgi:uncharacterized protein YuzE
MTVTYEEKTDVLYISLDDGPKQLHCQEVGDGIVFDLGDGNRIVGIEILDASKRVNLEQFLTLEYRKSA